MIMEINSVIYFTFRTESDVDETSEDEDEADLMGSKKLRFGDSGSRARTGNCQNESPFRSIYCEII